MQGVQQQVLFNSFWYAGSMSDSRIAATWLNPASKLGAQMAGQRPAQPSAAALWLRQ
jgi:hypothetical protein